MIFGKTGLQGLPTRFSGPFAEQGLVGVYPYSQHGILYCSRGRLGESPNTWKHFGPELTQVLNSIISDLLRQVAVVISLNRFLAPVDDTVTAQLQSQVTSHKRPRPEEVVTWAALDSGTGITGGGSGYAALLAHAGGALYGTELGSVTLKRTRIGFFCFQIKQLLQSPKSKTLNTHTRKRGCRRRYLIYGALSGPRKQKRPWRRRFHCTSASRRMQ